MSDYVPPVDLVLDALKFFPRSIGEALVNDRDFQKRFGQSFDAEITFGKNEATFIRSQFFSAMRTALGTPSSSVPVQDCSDVAWSVSVEIANGKRQIFLRREEIELPLPDFWALSPVASERLRDFDRHAGDCNLNDQSQVTWRDILATTPIINDYEELLAEFCLTPVGRARSIAEFINSGRLKTETLVPNERRYYDRLIGSAGVSSTLDDYAGATAPALIRQLLSWHPLYGLRLAFLLTAHSKISYAISAHEIDEQPLLETFEWLVHAGDRVSQTGAIEIGLEILDRHPKLEPSIIRMVEQIRDDNTDDENGRPVLLSSLIGLVAGKLAQNKTLGDMPPFWRRQAALAHASLIERELIAAAVDIKPFCEQVGTTTWQFFYMEGLVDLRIEPRWRPDYVAPRQIKAEFMSRIMNAAKRQEEKIVSAALRDLLLGNGEGSVDGHFEFPFYYYPGFLEGGVSAQSVIPPAIVAEVRGRLDREELEPASFAFLINYASVGRVEPEHAMMIAEALRRVKYHIKIDPDEPQAIALIDGLAAIAAVTRSTELANEVRVLARINRRRAAAINPELEFKIGLLAAASHVDLETWSRFVGGWMEELAFEITNGEGAQNLRPLIRRLCQVCPALWRTCSKADAALSSL